MTFFLPFSSPRAPVTLPKAQKQKQNKELSAVGKNQVQEHIRKLNMHKSMGPDEMRLWVLKHLANEVVKPISIIFEKPWQSNEVPLERENNLNF